jgi:hypothetical protein
MILFLDDWKKYPTAIANLDTTNKSFVRIAGLYREMGIKNHAFSLALVDRGLVGIDPFDTELSPEYQLRIAVECKLNPWFFFREILKAPAQAGGEASVFEANRGNMSLFWSFFNHITIILIQIRQTGKSFSTDGLMTYLMNIRCTNTEINLLTKDDTLRAANIKRLKDIEAELPFYLKQRTKLDTNNTEELTIKALGNKYRGHLPQKSPKMAYNVGRGLTSPIFQVDEGPFQPNIAISMPSALAAGTAARDKAEKNNEPYGTILTTTAGKKDDKDGQYIYKITQEAAEWTERFLDCRDLTHLRETVRNNSRKGVLRINATFNHTQLGKDDQWLKKAIEDSGAVGEDADRDFFNIWTSGTQSSPLSVHVLDQMRKSYIPPLCDEISAIGGYVTRWYIPENTIEEYMKNNKCVVSLDTSDASGGDDISFYINSVTDFETIATGTFNETNLITFAKWLVEVLVRFENLTMIIERRSSGVAIIDYLLLMLPPRGIDPFKRLFNWVVNNYQEDPHRYAEICQPLHRRPQDIYERYKKTFGFATSSGGSTSRSELYSTVLQAAAQYAASKVKDLTAINQIAGLVIRNGRVDHQPGEHDDVVIAWLLNYWFLSKGRNLSHYGIDSSSVLTRMVKQVVQTPQEHYRDQQQVFYRNKIQELVKELKESRDVYISDKIEREILSYNSKLILEENEKFSVDQLINSIKEDKKRNRSLSNRNSFEMIPTFQYRNPMKVF